MEKYALVIFLTPYTFQNRIFNQSASLFILLLIPAFVFCLPINERKLRFTDLTSSGGGWDVIPKPDFYLMFGTSGDLLIIDYVNYSDGLHQKEKEENSSSGQLKSAARQSKNSQRQRRKYRIPKQRQNELSTFVRI